MSRLQKKCLIASAALHGLLLLVLLVGPAFFVARQKPAHNLPVLDYIPARLIDEAMFGGGTPNAVLPPASEQPPAAQPAPPVLPRPVVTPPPDPKPTPKKPSESKATDTKSKPPSTKKSIDLDTTKVVKRKTSSKTASKESRAKDDAKDDARQAAAWQSLVNGVQQNLLKNLKPGTVIGIPGPGGEAYANYGQVIKSIYEKAWHKPTEAADDSAEVEVEVTLWRDGTVIRSRIVARSGNTVLDKSVQSVLDRVRTVPPFPEGAKDDERTFNITFRLKNNRLLG